MFHAAYQSRTSAPPNENKSGTTLARPTAAVKETGIGGEGDARQRCCFVAARRWRYGAGEPFCNAPAVAGSPYCARHLRRCAAPVGRAAELAAAAEAPPPPPELHFLAEAALPEPLPEAEADELRALLDIAPPARPGEE